MPQTDPATEPTLGQQVYDLIMSTIEPELTTSELPTLGEKYAEESPEEAQARVERYNRAFAEYDAQYQELMGGLEAQVQGYKREALATAEREEKEQAEKKIGEIESAIEEL